MKVNLKERDNEGKDKIIIAKKTEVNLWKDASAAVVDALISSANMKRSQTVTEAEHLNQSDAGMTPEANFDVKQR